MPHFNQYYGYLAKYADTCH